MKPIQILSALSLPLLLACGGGGGAEASSRGQLLVYLGADGQKDWQSIQVGIASVDVSTDGSHWTTVATPGPALVDLAQIQNGNTQSLATGVSLPAGTYTFRIVWSATGVAQAAGAPSGVGLQMPTQATVLQGSVTIGNSLTQAYLMVDAGRAIQPSASTYLFQPHPEVLDLDLSSELDGRVMIGTTPLAGQEVLAEIVNGTFIPTLVRRAVTNANGVFSLGPLPVSSAGVPLQYYLVCMPRTSGTTSFPAQGLGPLTLRAGVFSTGQDLLVSGSAATTGALNVTLTPVSPQGTFTYADLRQSVFFPGLGGSQTVIVREGAAQRGSSADTRLFDGLAPANYGVNGTRLTSPVATVTSPSTVAVTPGSTQSVSLSFP